MGTTYSATELIEFGQTEAVGAIDEDGVGARDVEAVFDDGCGDHHVGFVADEFQHNAFKFFFAHLTVADHYAGFGHQFLDYSGERADGCDALGGEVALAVAAEFAFDGPAAQLRTEWRR